MKPLIILVEDAIDQAHIMSAQIKAEVPGANIIIRDTVKEAIELLDKSKPQLLILDLTLKDGSGEEVLKHVRLTNKELPILIVTGNKADDKLSQLFDLGADDYVLKPVDDLIFQSKVRSMLTSRYISPLNFLGKREGLGIMKINTDFAMIALDEFKATMLANMHILPGAKFSLNIAEMTISFNVHLCQFVSNDVGYKLFCNVDTKTISNRSAFRRFLLENKKSFKASQKAS